MSPSTVAWCQVVTVVRLPCEAPEGGAASTRVHLSLASFQGLFLCKLNVKATARERWRPPDL